MPMPRHFGPAGRLCRGSVGVFPAFDAAASLRSGTEVVSGICEKGIAGERSGGMFPVCVVPDAGDGRRRGDSTLSFGGRRNGNPVRLPNRSRGLFRSGCGFRSFRKRPLRCAVRGSTAIVVQGGRAAFRSRRRNGAARRLRTGAFWNILAKPVYLLPENGLRGVSRLSFYDNV